VSDIEIDLSKDQPLAGHAPSEVDLGRLETVPIGKLQPYPNNPRKITQAGIDAVRQSIERYGYQQPIVVDQNYVIVVGHTRHQALLAMGVKEVPVYVAELTEEKAREFRLVDNRTGEMSGWDYGQLIMELREWEAPLLEQYFPDLNLDIVTSEELAVTQKQVDDAVNDHTIVPENKDLITTTVTCPSCFHEFEVATKSLPGLNRGDYEKLQQGGTA
jgi:hypothetical protein